MISKNIYKNYKILKKSKNTLKMSNKNLRKTTGYKLGLGLLLELKKGEDNNSGTNQTDFQVQRLTSFRNISK